MLKKEKYNTQLINIYLDNVINVLKIPTENRGNEWSKNLESTR